MFYLLLPDIALKIVFDVELESLNTRTRNLLNKDLFEIKLKPCDLRDSIVNNSKHNTAISNNSEILQSINKSGNLMTGKLILNSNNCTI